MTDLPHYYMIVNQGTLIHSKVVQNYPYHMVLAQVYAGAHQDYRTTLEWMRRQPRMMRLILDNGAHEGIDVDLDLYRKVIDQLRPDVIVLPDLVGRSAFESRSRSMAFAAEMTGLYPHADLMYASQGRSKEEILDDYEWAFDTLPTERYVIGFGQSYLTWEVNGYSEEEARYNLLNDLVKRFWKKPIRLRSHILGARWGRPPGQFATLAGIFNATGMDTIKPLTSTLQGCYYPVRKERKTDLMGMAVAGDKELTDNIDRLMERYRFPLWKW